MESVIPGDFYNSLADIARVIGCDNGIHESLRVGLGGSNTIIVWNSSKIEDIVSLAQMCHQQKGCAQGNFWLYHI